MKRFFSFLFRFIKGLLIRVTAVFFGISTGMVVGGYTILYWPNKPLYGDLGEIVGVLGILFFLTVFIVTLVSVSVENIFSPRESAQ